MQLYFTFTPVFLFIIENEREIRRECDKIKAPRSGKRKGKPLTTERQREERGKVKTEKVAGKNRRCRSESLFVPVVPRVVTRTRHSGSEGKFPLVIVPFKVNRT